MLLLRILAPHFVAGLVLGAGRAAPIVAYMRGWDEGQVRAYCARKGWRVERVPEGVLDWRLHFAEERGAR